MRDTSNAQTIDVLDVSSTKFAFMHSKIGTDKTYLYVVNMLMIFTQQYLALIPLLIKSIQE